VGEETWRLTRGEVGYEELGEVTVAGRAQPVATYEVALDTDATPDVATPFVGRNAEIQRLVGVFDDACRGANARLVTVLGSPGVGKTRLSRELCAHLADTVDAQLVEIRCDRAGAATFAPVGTTEEDSVFRYLDSASSRAGIRMANEKLELGKLAIVGLGGTGSYVLDLVAKAPVGEINLFDGDVRREHGLQHFLLTIPTERNHR